jgi:ketosteroid isomerase-like protein
VSDPIELVMPLYEAVERGDWDTPFSSFAPDVVWDMSGFGLPDLARVFHGHEGLREFWAAWASSWKALEFTRLKPEQVGDDVLVEVQQRNTGRASGVAVDFHYFQAWAVRNGKVTACCAAPTREEALGALGR